MSSSESFDIPHVSGAPRASFMDTILNPMLNTAIDNLSDSDSDMEEYTFEKGYERTLVMLKPKERLIAPHTEKELAELIQLRHVTRWMVNLLPEFVQLPFKKCRTMYAATVMRMRGSRAFAKTTLIFNLTIGVLSLFFHCLYLTSFSWQFILTSLHSAVLYSDNFWTWLLNDRLTTGAMAAEFENSDRASYSTWRDSFDIRNSEYVKGEGEEINPSKSMMAKDNQPVIKPPQGVPVMGATALQIVRSQISNMSNKSNTDVRTEPAQVTPPQKAAPAVPAFNMTVQSTTTPADSSPSSAPESKPKSPTAENSSTPPSAKSSDSSLKSLDSFHPTVFSSSSSQNSSQSSQKSKDD